MVPRPSAFNVLSASTLDQSNSTDEPMEYEPEPKTAMLFPDALRCDIGEVGAPTCRVGVFQLGRTSCSVP